MISTGGAETYALRRQGIGIIQIMLKENFVFSLSSMINKGLEAYIDDLSKREKISLKIKEFFKNRIINILIDMGFSKEAVNSALWASFDNIPDLVLRVKAIDSLKKDQDFELLCITFKRVENIIKKAKIKDLSSKGEKVNESLFQNACENELSIAVTKVDQEVQTLIQKGDYNKALLCIATLRSKVDVIFDDVMVMAEDKKIKDNRLALLSSVAKLFKSIADFSIIATAIDKG